MNGYFIAPPLADEPDQLPFGDDYSSRRPDDIAITVGSGVVNGILPDSAVTTADTNVSNHQRQDSAVQLQVSTRPMFMDIVGDRPIGTDEERAIVIQDILRQDFAEMAELSTSIRKLQADTERAVREQREITKSIDDMFADVEEGAKKLNKLCKMQNAFLHYLSRAPTARQVAIRVFRRNRN